MTCFLDELSQLLDHLEELIVDTNAKLVVIDSIAALFRHSAADREGTARRQVALTKAVSSAPLHCNQKTRRFTLIHFFMA